MKAAKDIQFTKRLNIAIQTMYNTPQKDVPNYIDIWRDKIDCKYNYGSDCWIDNMAALNEVFEDLKV